LIWGDFLNKEKSDKDSSGKENAGKENAGKENAGKEKRGLFRLFSWGRKNEEVVEDISENEEFPGNENSLERTEIPQPIEKNTEISVSQGSLLKAWQKWKQNDLPL